MELTYDDIDEVISRLSSVKSEISDAFSCMPDRGYKEQIGKLFRVIHSCKAGLSYMDLDEVSSILEKSEDIMSFLNNHDCTIGKEVRHWFYLMEEQLSRWIDEFILLSKEYSPEINMHPPTFYNEELDNQPTVKVSDYKLEKVCSHRVLVLLPEITVATNLERMLFSSFTNVNTSNSVNSISKILSTSTEPKILISDIKFTDGTLVDIVNQRLLSNTQLIVYSRIEKPQIEKIKHILKTEHVYDTNSTSLQDIKKIALNCAVPNINYVTIPFKSTRISIADLTKSIKPMPDIVEQIKKACFNDSIHYSKMAEIIEQDMVVTGRILKHINSPYYGLRTPVTSVQKALNLLGKQNIYTITIQGIVDELFGQTDISMYGIAYDDIIHINKIRNKLLKSWCIELGLSLESFETINTVSLLLVLGTILTAKALSYNLQGEKFKSMKELEPITTAEKKLLDYTSYDVSIKIFTQWLLPEIFVSIANKMPCTSLNKNYSNIDKMAYIITVLHQVIRIDGKFEINEHIIKSLNQNGIGGQTLITAFEKVYDDHPKSGTFTDLINFDEDFKMQ